MRGCQRSLVLAIITVCATCVSADAFTDTWTDQFGETVYQISGPDAVVVGETVTIVLAVSDPTYPDNWVASSWSFVADGVQQDGGFSIWTTGGIWSRSYDFVYGDPGSHTYTFRAQDLGHGGGHDYAWFEISGTTQILPGTGACCFPDGSCDVLTEGDCTQQGGAFLGAGTLCDPNPCPQPAMACCFPDGHCEMLTADACVIAGGIPSGYGTDCDPNDCAQPPPPTGACCLDDQASCEVMTEDACIAQGGVYQGDDTGCDPNPCPIVPARISTWGQIKASYR